MKKHISMLAAVLVLGSVTHGAVAQDGDIAAQLTDAIVGTWVGEAVQGENKWDTKLMFMSPRGGVSRYPGFPCGGTLVGDRKGDKYEFTEAITWGGLDEKSDGCIGGVVTLTIDGDKMQYHWASTWNGQEYTADGELKRVGKKR